MAKKLIISQPPTHPDGIQVGENTTDKLGFLGTEPIVRPSGAAQAAVVATSTDGTAAAAADLAALKAEAELIGDDVRALIAAHNALRTALVNLGLIKGAA